MSQSQNFNIQQESELKKIYVLFLRNHTLFILSLIIAIGLAYLINRYSIPEYKISSSILIKENQTQQGGGNVNDFINSNLFGNNQNFQNELWVLKSSPVIEKTIRNLELETNYYRKDGFQYKDAYQDVPFQINYLSNHTQPVNVRFSITFLNNDLFQINAKSKSVSFYNFASDEITHQKNDWVFVKNGKFGELIETSDLAFVVEPDTSKKEFLKEASIYGFDFKTVASYKNGILQNMEFNVVDRAATVIEIILKSESLKKGIDIVNELMDVYSEQNLEKKNHIASITIGYIEKQLNEISDSLSQTEDNLQNFRSSNQLLNITDQATGISTQYMDLQNQLAELISRKRYYDYVSELLKNDNFSNMMLPASIGISDPLLTSLMSELISAQAQRSNLIENNQERNPLVQKLGIQIENVKKTISENIDAVGKTTIISIDEMNKRVKKIEAEINRLPATQRQLGVIERKYRLNDAIYNYLLEKHAEAKITKASNLPDYTIIEPAAMVGYGPISNSFYLYLIALCFGLGIPFSYVMIKSMLNNKIVAQEDIEKLTDNPILGKMLHSNFKTNNVMFEFPKSNVAETFRTLRTNLEFCMKGDHNKVIMITSCLENEGKSFIALNLAMSYAQLGRKSILVDFDLRKPKQYFNEDEESHIGLSSYMINEVSLEEIIRKSPHEKLDYIVAGLLPPNPVELIALGNTEKLITELKTIYDVIILDTSPLAQVTDAYLLINQADLRVVISRLGYTFKNVFALVMKDLQQKNVNNIYVVINDNRYAQDQYGYGYGYYNKKRVGRYKRQKSKIN
jgi:capsular exopolysaccharide synthesis family protein